MMTDDHGYELMTMDRRHEDLRTLPAHQSSLPHLLNLSCNLYRARHVSVMTEEKKGES